MEETLRILVVEDEAVTRRALVRSLRAGNTDLEVREEEDGLAAARLLESERFDCVVLDYLLPGLNGLAVLRQLREVGNKTPIIVLTAKGDEQLAVEMMKSGANDYLSKSRLSPEALVQRVRNAVRVHRAEQYAAESAERLRAHEQRLSRVLETNIDGIVILDANGNFDFINPAAQSILGVQAGDITGQSVQRGLWQRATWSAQPQSDSQQPFRRVLETGEPVRGVEMVIHRRDNSRVIVSVNAAPLTDVSGTVTGVVGSIRDITDQKRADLLREAQTRVMSAVATGASLSEALETLARGIEGFLTDAFAAVLLIDGDRLIPGAAPSLPPAFGRRLEEGIPFNRGGPVCLASATLHGRVIASDIASEPLWAGSACRDAALAVGIRACWSQPILSSGSEALGALVLYHHQPRIPEEHDLRVMETAASLAEIAIRRKLDEGALRKTHDTLQTLVQASPLAIQALDEQGIVRLWNFAAERVFGFTAKETIGQPPLHVPPHQRQLADQYIRRIMIGESFSDEEFRCVHRDGHELDVSFSAAPLRDEHGRINGIVSIIADVTERKRLKEQLQQSQKMEAVGRLAGGIAHDFNNLLAVISGYSESMARRLRETDPLRSHAAEIQKAAERGASLTRQLLAFSRRQVIKPQRLDLNHVVADLQDMLRRVITDKVGIIFKPDKDLRPIEADHGQMEQVVLNLALNARDAMPSGGTLTIRTANVELMPGTAATATLKPGDYVRLTVADTGYGIDATTRQHIFEPFFTTKEGKGTGLGLSIVYGIAQQAGGGVAVESEAGKGARFDVYFPAVD